jgi:hypothetical protein
MQTIMPTIKFSIKIAWQKVGYCNCIFIFITSTTKIEIRDEMGGLEHICKGQNSNIKYLELNFVNETEASENVHSQFLMNKYKQYECFIFSQIFNIPNCVL